jgi:hypothetical protein
MVEMWNAIHRNLERDGYLLFHLLGGAASTRKRLLRA